MTKIGDAKRKLHGKLTGRPDNFSWLIEGKLAGSAIPTSKKEVFGCTDPTEINYDPLATQIGRASCRERV